MFTHDCGHCAYLGVFIRFTLALGLHGILVSKISYVNVFLTSQLQTIFFFSLEDFILPVGALRELKP